MPTIHRTIVTLAAAFCLLPGTVAPASASTVKFPAKDPTFILDVPEGWMTKTDKDGTLSCDPGNDAEYAVKIIPVPDLQTKAEITTALPIMAKKIGEQSKLTNVEVGDIEKTKNGKDIPFVGLRADGKSSKIPLVIILHAFEPQKGQWYILLTVGTEKSDADHSADYDSIYDSIQPLG